MELLKGYTGTVTFVVPSTVQTARFSVEKAGVTIGTTQNATIADGIASCVLPYDAIAEEGSIKVTITFTTNAKTYSLAEECEVVSPILPIHEIRQLTNNINEDEARVVESAVRHIIQAHTGQTFGHFVGIEVVTGSGERMLRLPRRLITLNSVNQNTYWTSEYYLHRDQYFLVARNPYWEGGIRADYDGYQGEWISDVPIYAPPVSKHFVFQSNTNYSIDGEWGWIGVPQAVKEAAKLLVNDYACGDNVYRDRFVQIATGPDWRLEFNNGAYGDTGNVRANQLLENYVIKYGWEVV